MKREHIVHGKTLYGFTSNAIPVNVATDLQDMAESFEALKALIEIRDGESYHPDLQSS
jgi:hypothetical protein